MTMEQYHYEHDGHTITLPHVKNVPIGIIRKSRKLEGVDQAFTILEALLGDDDLEVIDSMDGKAFEKMMSDWQEASGVQLGESSASSTT